MMGQHAVLVRLHAGGLLGDDMGLGKTIQSIAFIAAILGRCPASSLSRDKQSTSDSPSKDEIKRLLRDQEERP